MDKNKNNEFVNNSLIKCDYCFITLKVRNYKKHLLQKHKVQLPAIFDLKSKIKIDNEYFNNQKKIKEEKRKQKEVKRIENEKIRIKKEEAENLKTEEIRQEFIEKNKIEILIIWDHILFDSNRIRFQNTQYKKLNSFFCNGVITALNLIKKDYFNRLYGKKFYRLAFINNELVFDDKHSPGLSKMLDAIEFALEYYNFLYIKNRKYKIILEPKITNKEIIKLFQINRFKFLDKLANLQSEDYKIIPLIEFINNHKEECFIFRVKSKHKGVITFWENVNPSRACHVFFSESTEIIQGFILREDLTTKRSLLYSKLQDSAELRSELNYHTSIKHSDLNTFSKEIDKLLNYK